MRAQEVPQYAEQGYRAAPEATPDAWDQGLPDRARVRVKVHKMELADQDEADGSALEGDMVNVRVRQSV